MSWNQVRQLTVWTLLWGASAAAWAGGLPAPAERFIQSNCIECHDADSARAGFRIDLLTEDFAGDGMAGQWKGVLDKVNSGAMPPARKARPDASQTLAFTGWVEARLRQTAQAARAAGGRVPVRRMNRAEYANTVRDLFGLDEQFARRVETELPADGKVGGFDRGAAGLFMDEGQLAQYMAVAGLVLDEGVFAEKPKVAALSWDATRQKYVHGIGVCWRDESGAVHEDNPTPEFVSKLKDPLSMIPVDGFEQHNSKTRRYVPHGVFPWSVENGGIEYLSGGSNYRRPGNLRAPFFPPDWGDKVVTRDGWYRFTVKAGASRGEGAEARKDVRLTVEYGYGSPIEVVRSQVIDAPLNAPREYEFLMYLRVGAPGMKRSWSIGWDNGDKDVAVVNPAYQDVQWKQVTVAGQIEQAVGRKASAEQLAALHEQSERAIADALENRKTFAGPYYVFDPKLDVAKRPRLWVGPMRFEGPLVEWPPKGRQSLFFAGEGRADDAYLREIFARFLPRAYRRPVAAEEVDRVVKWALAAKADGNGTFADAVREGLKNVLCSPAFLYLGVEEADPAAPAAASAVASAAPATSPAPAGPQPVGDWQLATRLSYLLWSSTPDEELYDQAGRHRLRDPQVLRAQVKRMLADPRAAELARNFAGQWLSVRNFPNGNPPNRDFYRTYDDALRDSSRQEPLEFFGQVLKQNLPITDFLDSDFLVIDERLARHYGIDGVEGDQFRRVPAPADGRRGGILGMAGILTYLADGTRTLPIRRAAWVLDTLWNQPVPPPPPNVGDLPVVKGKNLSVRARLDAHRTSASCASCHTRVDPFGMALENYDAVGAWRDRQNGEGMRGDANSPPLDVSGQLPDGRAFATPQQYKAALVADKGAFVRGFTEKLLCYALGRPIGYADHLAVDAIDAEAARGDDRLQDLIQALVADPYFQTR